MQPSDVCYNLTKRAEDEPGFLAGRCSTLTAYRCPSGLWTCGWGRTRGITESTTCTPEQADAWLVEDMREAARIVGDRVHVPLTQGQFDACCSFVYNIRRELFTEKLCTLLRWLNAGLPAEQVAEQFARWVYGRDPKTGRPVKLDGLVARREAEKALFLS